MNQQYYGFSHELYANQAAYRQYPPVDPTVFVQSASSYSGLLADASLITGRLSASQALARQLMDAAQQNKKEQVKRLIRSIGIQSDFEITYTPERMSLTLFPKGGRAGCCQLNMVLRWR